MPTFIAQTTYSIGDKPVSEGTFYFSILFLVLGLIALRVFLDRLDRSRIREHVTESGGQVLNISWTPFGCGWFGDASDRIYEVTYRTKAGKTITATCKTSMFSGVYWTSDTAPDSFPSNDTVSGPAECLACGSTISEGGDRCPKCGWSYKDSPPNKRDA